MKKTEYIAKYGEEAWEKKLETTKEWKKRNREYCNLYSKQYRTAHQDEGKAYREANKEKIAEYQRQYYQANKEKRAEYCKQHHRDNKEVYKKWYQDNKEKVKERVKQYNQEHKEEIALWHKQYREERKDYYNEYNKSQIAKADNLCCKYRKFDQEKCKGACTLTGQWIINNIFTKTCLYCGEKDWRKLGCDRIDNDLPHTPDNVVCSCSKCNKERNQTGFEVFLYKSWRRRFY